MNYKVFVSVTGDEIGTMTLEQSMTQGYQVVFQSGWVVNLSDQFSFNIHNTSRTNGNVMGHKSVVRSISDLYQNGHEGFIKSTSPVTIWNDQTIDERMELLNSIRKEVGRERSNMVYQHELERIGGDMFDMEGLVNSLGYVTYYKEAPIKNRFGLFTSEMGLVMLWDGSVDRVITEIHQGAECWNVVDKDDSVIGKEIVVPGVSMVPFVLEQ